MPLAWASGQEEVALAAQVPVPRWQAGGGEAEARSRTAVVVARVEQGAELDAIEADSVFRRGVSVRSGLRVGVVTPARFGGGGLDSMDPGAWIGLALSPASGEGSVGGAGAEAGEISVVEIEPGSVDGVLLAGLDAVFLPRPDLLSDDAWGRVRTFVETGGMAVVSPPPQLTVHLWGDGMARALGGGWRVIREARVLEGAGARLESVTPGVSSSTPDLLGLVRGELEEMTRAVRVSRVLPLEGRVDPTGARVGAVPPGSVGLTLLSLADGTPWIVAARPETTRGGERGEGTELSRGMIVYLASAPELSWTDMPAKPLMVALMQELVRQGVGAARSTLSATAGQFAPAPMRAVELVREATAGGQGGEGMEERLPVGPDGLTSAPARRGGVYRALDASRATRDLVSINADARGGDTRAAAPGAVQRWLGTSGATVRQLAPASGAERSGAPEQAWADVLGGSEEASSVSTPMLAAALLLLLLETFLARRASHADRVSEDRDA